jgi:hypothetical protein
METTKSLRPKRRVSELEKRTVNALVLYIRNYPGIETKLLRGYLALQLLAENGRLPYSLNGTRLTKLPTTRHLIAMLRRDRRVRWTNRNPFFLRWYAVKTYKGGKRSLGNRTISSLPIGF